MMKNKGCVNTLKDLRLDELDALGYVYLVGRKGNQGKPNQELFSLRGNMGTEEEWTALLGSYDKDLETVSPNLGKALEELQNETNEILSLQQQLDVGFH